LVCFSFTYLPHWPHRTTRSENAYQATRIILGSALSAVTLFENYHLIHHLRPNIPFYRYRKAYLATRDELLASLARGPPLRSRFGRARWYRHTVCGYGRGPATHSPRVRGGSACSCSSWSSIASRSNASCALMLCAFPNDARACLSRRAPRRRTCPYHLCGGA
ncbi:MAG: hypothetical protein GY811_01255, partial [Myxococcales bacterium]|nr:hypothetical protein [Myxococcales bacterium]